MQPEGLLDPKKLMHTTLLANGDRCSVCWQLAMVDKLAPHSVFKHVEYKGLRTFHPQDNLVI